MSAHASPTPRTRQPIPRRLAAFLRTLFVDFRYALRSLRNAPGYAATAVLTLALGLGAVTAMLAIIDSVLLQPVALPHSSQLVVLERTRKADTSTSFGFKETEAFAQSVPAFAGVAFYDMFPKPVTTAGGTRISGVMETSPNYFQMLGVHARLGRTFSKADKDANVAVVSDAFWRDTLHSDPKAIGSTVKAQGRLFTVIGVMPAGFYFPPQSFDFPTVCVPYHLDAKGNNALGIDEANTLARLKSGVSMAVADEQFRAAYAHNVDAAKQGWRGHLRSYRSTITSKEQPALLALLGASTLLLLLACANAANLQVVRGTMRAGEISMRAALGASRSRLFQQIAVESVTVSLLGAGHGLLLAYGIVSWARSAYAGQFARFNELTLHPLVYVGCAAIAVVTGLLAASAPAIAAVRHAARAPNLQSARTTSKSKLSAALVSAEVALTCVLLVTAGLFLRTFSALAQAPLGFNPQDVTQVVLMPVNPEESGVRLKATWSRLIERLAAMPGVEAAATQTSLPFSNYTLSLNTNFLMPGYPHPKDDAVSLSMISTGYNRTMGVSMLRGRTFLPRDTEEAQGVAIVNQAFVRKFLHGDDPLGKVVEFPSDGKPGDEPFLKHPLTIVGLAPDQVDGKEIASVEPTLFLDYRQFPATGGGAKFVFGFAPQFAVRSTLPQGTLVREIRTVLKQDAPDMAEMRILPMEEAIAKSLSQRKIALRLASGFGLLALLLAAIGIYGVLAYTVAQRTREIGIRMALGSSRAGAMRLVLRQAGSMVAIGLAVGLVAAWPAGQAVRSFLFGVHPLDPLTLFLAAILLLLVAALAAAVPAYRATQVDPMEALRTE